MSADEDTELRDLLTQTLEKNGALSKIKAELRASVFLALDAHENFDNCPLINRPLQRFLKEKDAIICIELIMEFFEALHLDYTNAVFVPEINNAVVDPPKHEILCKKLGLKTTSKKKLPLLASVLRTQKLDKPTFNSERSSPSDEQLKNAKNLFDDRDRIGAGYVDVSDVVDIFSLVCPMFPVFLIDRFVSEHLSSSNQRVTWNDFSCLYDKLFAACHSVVSPPEPGLFGNNSQALGDSKMDLKTSNDAIDKFYDDCLNVNTPTNNKSDEEPSLSLKSSVSVASISASKIPVQKTTSRHSINSKARDAARKDYEDDYEDDFTRDDTKNTEKSNSARKDYDDDFTADTESIPEDLPESVGDILSSGSSNSLADLTEDHSISLSAHVDADYMEESNA